LVSAIIKIKNLEVRRERRHAIQKKYKLVIRRGANAQNRRREDTGFTKDGTWNEKEGRGHEAPLSRKTRWTVLECVVQHTVACRGRTKQMTQSRPPSYRDGIKFRTRPHLKHVEQSVTFWAEVF
jgi:hypothetical protein